MYKISLVLFAQEMEHAQMLSRSLQEFAQQAGADTILADGRIEHAGQKDQDRALAQMIDEGFFDHRAYLGDSDQT